MKFPFYKYPAAPDSDAPWHVDPRLEVRLENPDSGDALEVVALLDSGAGNNLFSAELAEALGILNLEAGEQKNFFGISNQKAIAYGHQVLMSIGGHRFETKVYFSQHVGRETILLGMQGFFDRFIVIIDRARETIELKPNK